MCRCKMDSNAVTHLPALRACALLRGRLRASQQIHYRFNRVIWCQNVVYEHFGGPKRAWTVSESCPSAPRCSLRRRDVQGIGRSWTRKVCFVSLRAIEYCLFSQNIAGPRSDSVHLHGQKHRDAVLIFMSFRRNGQSNLMCFLSTQAMVCSNAMMMTLDISTLRIDMQSTDFVVDDALWRGHYHRASESAHSEDVCVARM